MTSFRPLLLAADDDPDILAFVRFRLERDGYEVLSAPDGETARDLALARPPDLALLDVMMPQLDGYEVTRRLCAHGPTAMIPITLLTARVQEPDVAHGFEAGAETTSPSRSARRRSASAFRRRWGPGRRVATVDDARHVVRGKDAGSVDT